MQIAMHLINKPFQKNTFCYAKVIKPTNIYKVDCTKYRSFNGENGLKNCQNFRPFQSVLRLIASAMRLGGRP
jgi:hypothetical protein